MVLPEAVARLTDRFLADVDAALPGRLRGLFLHGSICWGEHFRGSDVDFVALWDELPTGADLAALADAHAATAAACPAPVFDGFHCTATDLAGPAARVGTRPVFFAGRFDAAGTADINPVTWHEPAERAVVVRGELPPVHTDPEALRAYTAANLDTYWRDHADRLEATDPAEFGASLDDVGWVVLGAGRLHHLLTTGTLTSKSGGGRHVLDRLHPRFHPVAMEAVQARESAFPISLYGSPADRGRDAADLLRWLVTDGTAP